MLDEAVDEAIKAKLRDARGKTFFGCGIASDESPPAANRYAGFRFQVTYVYCPVFAEESTWELAAKAPVTTEQYLLDVVHCPAKDGQTVVSVIGKQLSRLGLSLADIVSGTGDGGGENEGMLGVHATLERDVGDGSYVRRRCLGHLSWRSADAGLDSMGVYHKETQAICNYIHDGITFRRLQSIASQPLHSSGLNLFREQSADFLAIFARTPCTILDGRPETVSHFLQWLVPREHVLAACVTKDVLDRNLGDNAKMARDALADNLGRVRRAIHYELLERSLFLFRWGKKHGLISTSTTLSELTSKCLRIVTSLVADDFFLRRFGIAPGDVVAKGCTVQTYIAKSPCGFRGRAKPLAILDAH